MWLIFYYLKGKKVTSTLIYSKAIILQNMTSITSYHPTEYCLY